MNYQREAVNKVISVNGVSEGPGYYSTSFISTLEMTWLVTRAPASLWLRALPGTGDSAFHWAFIQPFAGDEHRPDRAEWRLIKSNKLSFAGPLKQPLFAAHDKSRLSAHLRTKGAAAKQHTDTVLIGI